MLLSVQHFFSQFGWCSLEGCSQAEPFIVGRSRKQKVELGGSAVTERLTVDGRSFSYQQLEGSFSQPNAGDDKAKVSLECTDFASCAL